MVKKYVKTPVVIEAIEFTYDANFHEKLDLFTNGDSAKWIFKSEKHDIFDLCPTTYYTTKAIPTTEEGRFKEDDMDSKYIASVGDYIIKGVNGEFYPCKPDIFKKTYSEVLDFPKIQEGSQ